MTSNVNVEWSQLELFSVRPSVSSARPVPPASSSQDGAPILRYRRVPPSCRRDRRYPFRPMLPQQQSLF